VVPDEKGSFTSVVHQTVVGVRAALTGISKKHCQRLRAEKKISLRNMMMRLRSPFPILISQRF
jgi:hypothetical protein